MEKVKQVLDEIQKINNAYEIPTENITKLREEMETIKVCTPIIGKFSSGKSALVNTILGYDRRILKEDITPETAIPAEIIYTDAEDGITIVRNNGTCKEIDVDDYRTFEADATTTKCARIHLNNHFLKEIRDVMLVDMPGFESGFEVHNKAIEDYLPQSLAYIVAFPADDLIVRSSVGNMLKELCLYDMPLCIVITKCDKKNDDFDVTLENMKENLKRFIGDREVTFCFTSSANEEVEQVQQFLQEIQNNSKEILAKKYKKSVLSIIENTENYLKTRLNNSQLSESELAEQEEKLQKQLSVLDSKFSKERGEFELELAECVEEIKNDVQCAMEMKESTFVTMAMNKQDISAPLNTVVRNAVTTSVRKRFIPKVEKYLKKVSDSINSESLGDVRVSFYFDTENLNKGMTTSIVAVVAGVLLHIPIIGVLAGVALKIFGDNKKREQAKAEIRTRLQNEVYPQVMLEVGNNLETAIAKQMSKVNASIETELNNQHDTLEKAMTDVREKINDETTKKENLAIDINADLERIEGFKNELR